MNVLEVIGFFMAMLAGATMDEPNIVNITIALGGALIIVICTRLEGILYGEYMG